MPGPTSRSSHRQAGIWRYGIDAPYVPAILGIVAIGCLVAGAAVSGQSWLLVVGAVFAVQVLIFMHTTLRGKRKAWEGLLDDLCLGGDEQLLDIGCGRGAVLMAAAKRLPAGRAHGVDLWRSKDQSGNDESVTAANAKAEGVSDRVELHTGDMTDLPFPDGSFDVVTSSLAIHNLPALSARYRAIDEALRVLRPGGRLMIADIRSVKQYGGHLRSSGATDVSVRNLGVRFWYAGPWQATSAVTATKP